MRGPGKQLDKWQRILGEQWTSQLGPWRVGLGMRNKEAVWEMIETKEKHTLHDTVYIKL